MRGGPARALLRSGIYVLLACLLMLAGSAAYASQSITSLPSAAVIHQPATIARPLPSATPAPPVTTVPAASGFDQLRSDLEAIAARSGARVGISLQELSGPRRNNLSLGGGASFTAAWVNAALGRLGGAAARQWLFALLTHTANEQGLPAGLPASATVVHKVGTLDGTENDSGYVVSRRTSYVLSVAVEGLDETLGSSLIAQISARIWQYETGRPDFLTPVVATPFAPSPRLNRH